MTDISISNTQSAARPAILVRLRDLVAHGMARLRAVFRRPARVYEVSEARKNFVCYRRRHH